MSNYKIIENGDGTFSAFRIDGTDIGIDSFREEGEAKAQVDVSPQRASMR